MTEIDRLSIKATMIKDSSLTMDYIVTNGVELIKLAQYLKEGNPSQIFNICNVITNITYLCLIFVMILKI